MNIENDPSTSQEGAGAYLSEEIWGKVSQLNFIGKMGLEIVVNKENRYSCVIPKLYFLSISPFSLSLSLFLSLPLSLSHSYERTSIKGTIMQVNVIYALKP